MCVHKKFKLSQYHSKSLIVILFSTPKITYMIVPQLYTTRASNNVKGHPLNLYHIFKYKMNGLKWRKPVSDKIRTKYVMKYFQYQM